MYTLKEIIEKAKKVHGDRYDYSKSIYTRLVEPMEIICKVHGSFWQSPHAHLKGQGCPICGVEKRSEKRKDTTDTFIEKAKRIHGDKYDYSKVEYVSTHEKVCIICPQHGEFWQQPNVHLNGRGCPHCAREITDKNNLLTKEEFIERVNKKHGKKYDYSKVEYKGCAYKVEIVCPKHGSFIQMAEAHLNGSGCPYCAKELNAKRHRKDTEKFIEDAKLVHGDKYSYEHTIYNGCYEPVTISCPKHGDFKQIASYHLSGNGCPKCSNQNSKPEEEIYEFIKECLPNVGVERKNRTILDGGKEIDIFIPSKKIGVEFDGLHWHNENFSDKNEHKKKTDECSEKGIMLIHIFEDEWMFKNDICRSRLRSIFGTTKNKIFARKCEVRKIDAKTSREFNEMNHIQGNAIGKYRYGLFYKDQLVSVMVFSELRKNIGSKKEEGVFELLRFCNKIDTNVVGGASKLLKHFISEMNPVKIISYCDLRWSSGNMYDRIGFTLDHISRPNYFYIIGKHRKNRFCYRKDILVKKYECPKEMTEHEFCKKMGWLRIYDCGTKVYVWKKDAV